MAGAGNTPAGGGPAGQGGPSFAVSPPLPRTPMGAPQARALDPRTGRIAFDACGRPLRTSGVRQRVLLALLTERGSACVLELGHTLRDVKFITPSTHNLVETIVRTALAALIANFEIELISVEVDLESRLGVDRLPVRVRWRDLVGNVEEEETL